MFQSKRQVAKDRPRERGVVIIYTAFFMLFLLGFVAIGIDVSKLMATRTQLQRAADAAALAGASGVDTETGIINQDTALVRATQTANLNKAFVKSSTGITLLAGDVTFPQPNQCKVVVRRDPTAGGSMVTHVAQVLGITSLSVTAAATAQAELASGVCEGLIPMAPVEPPNSGWFDPSCGNTVNLKVDPGTGQSGNYQLLEFPDCQEGNCGDVQGGGGAAIRCQTAYGYSCCVDVGQTFTVTEPGVKTGPFTKGLDQRWDADTDRRENICFQDYTGNGQRVVRLPIVETFDLSGKKVVRIKSFAAFFLTQKVKGNGEMLGQFMYDTAPGNPGGTEGTIFTLRLVQ